MPKHGKHNLTVGAMYAQQKITTTEPRGPCIFLATYSKIEIFQGTKVVTVRGMFVPHTFTSLTAKAVLSPATITEKPPALLTLSLADLLTEFNETKLAILKMPPILIKTVRGLALSLQN